MTFDPCFKVNHEPKVNRDGTVRQPVPDFLFVFHLHFWPICTVFEIINVFANMQNPIAAQNYGVLGVFGTRIVTGYHSNPPKGACTLGSASFEPFCVQNGRSLWLCVIKKKYPTSKLHPLAGTALRGRFCLNMAVLVRGQT